MSSHVDIYTEHSDVFTLLKEYDAGGINTETENVVKYLSDLSEEIPEVYKYTENLPQMLYDIEEISACAVTLEENISASINRDFSFLSSSAMSIEEIISDIFSKTIYRRTLGEQISSIFSDAVLTHYFIDGNKRFACSLLLWLSYRNNITILEDTAYAALAILTASQGNKESQKNKMLAAYLLDLCSL